MSIIDKELTQIMKNIRDYISQHEETKNLQIHDRDVLVVYNYLQNKAKINSLYRKIVLKTIPYIHVVFEETKQIQQIDFENDLEKINNLFNQELELDDFDLKKFQIRNDIQNKVLEKSKKIIKSFSTYKKGFYLHGHFETGKTFLLKSLTKELIKKKIPVLFFFMPDLIRQFKGHIYYNELSENKLNYLKKIPCLILDDFGSVNMNVVFRDDILFSFLNYRYEKKLITFFSSNLDIKQLYNYFESHKDFNSDVRASKIILIIQGLVSGSYDFSFS